MEKLNLIKKDMNGEPRWFVKTNDGFDGTAQGYGYKTPDAVYRAYAWFKSKDKRKQQKKDLNRFFKENPDIKSLLDAYFSEDEMFYRYKDGEDSSMKDFMNATKIERPDIVEKIVAIKYLWKTIETFYGLK